MFILLGRDRDAPLLVRIWALLRETAIEMGAKPESDRAQVTEARRCAYEMDRYRLRARGIISNEQYEAAEAYARRLGLLNKDGSVKS